ncbi:amphi-Trp domain-containing protein [Streptomyces sp. L7]
MKDLKFEQKRSLSRFEAADQLRGSITAAAPRGRRGCRSGTRARNAQPADPRRPAQRDGGRDRQWGDRAGDRVQVADHAAPAPPSRTVAATKKARGAKKAPAEPGRSGTRTSRSKNTKRSASKAN